jgi:hypothetical protein
LATRFPLVAEAAAELIILEPVEVFISIKRTAGYLASAEAQFLLYSIQIQPPGTHVELFFLNAARGMT